MKYYSQIGKYCHLWLPISNHKTCVFTRKVVNAIEISFYRMN